MDGRADAVHAYLRHFWDHWSAPEFSIPDADLDRLVDHYAQTGAFTASIGWYRAGSGTVARSLAEHPPAPDDRIAVAAHVLWPEHDPLCPVEWSDRLEEYFSAVRLTRLPGSGHFSPLEAPDAFAEAIRDSLR